MSFGIEFQIVHSATEKARLPNVLRRTQNGQLTTSDRLDCRCCHPWTSDTGSLHCMAK